MTQFTSKNSRWGRTNISSWLMNHQRFWTKPRCFRTRFLEHHQAPTSQDLSDRVEKWVKHFFTFFSTCLDLTLPKSYSTVPERITDLHWSYMDDFSFSRFHFWGNEDYSHKKCLNWSKQGSLHRFKRNLHQDFPLCHRLVETTTVPDMPSSCSLELLAFADPRF